MASAVGLRPNHYEVLGLSPAASQEDITRAFASAMSLFGARSMAAAAQMSLAFEVLRNPAKRRAYDRSLGIAADPDPRHWTVTTSMRARPAFIGSAWTRLTEEAVSENLARPVREEVATAPEPSTHPRLASFIASSLRDARAPVATAAVAQTSMKPEERGPEASADAQLERHIERFLAKADVEEAPGEADDRHFEWKRPALTVGGLLLIAGVIGTFAGLSARDGADTAQAQAAIPAPRAKPRPAVAASAPAAVEPTFEPIPQRSLRTAAPKIRHRAPPKPLASAHGQTAAAPETQASGPAETQPSEASSDPLAPSPTSATADPTAIPLSDKVVARTIERIGYRCGEVAFTTAVAGAPGSYKVTCSSGQTYQASPVRGRYHFRRLGSH
jgi:hypothetical protein